LLKRPLPIPKWGVSELGADSAKLAPMQLLELAPPPDMGRACVTIEGATIQEKAERLAAVFMEIR
jgi:hypothetical protein